MSSIADRLRQARVNAGYQTAAEAARAFGWNANTYTSAENGNRPPGRTSAARYARAFGVTLDWLLDGRGQSRTNRKTEVPIMGVVGAGAEILPIDDETSFEPIEAPPGCPDGAIAFAVRGDSQWPAYEDGGVVIAIPVTQISDVINRRAVVNLADGRRLLKTVTVGSMPGCYTLISHNAPPIANVTIVAAARVRWYVEP